MNREILRIAVPNIISNITVPLMGIVSTAIAGHWGDSAHTIGALAIGVSIFNFIYWNCSFIRMGTSGLTAQAYGAGDWTECTNMLVRALAVSVVLGIAVLLLQYPIGELSLIVMNGDEMAREYFYARIWAVPAGIVLFGFNGWFTGMQNAIIPMCTSITVNAVHIVCSLWFALGMDMGIVGIAYASIVAQYSGLTLAVVLLLWRYRRKLTRVDWRVALDMEPMRRFFRINSDIIVRTFCIVIVYTFFTAASARMGNAVLLAVNTMLMELFTMFSYMNDGFAYAAEALTGRFIGARDGRSLRMCVKRCFLWTSVIALVFVGIYIGWWRELLGLFIEPGSPEAPAILDLARQYIGWVIVIPLAAAIPFTMDGVMVGATQTRVMRNSMLLATASHFIIFYGLSWLIGNNALWLAFTSYMFLRGIFQYFMSGRLSRVFEMTDPAVSESRHTSR